MRPKPNGNCNLTSTARNFQNSAFRLTSGRRLFEPFTYQAQLNYGHPIPNGALTDSENEDHCNPDRNLLWWRVLATNKTLGCDKQHGKLSYNIVF